MGVTSTTFVTGNVLVMKYFEYNILFILCSDKSWCVDATEESGKLGRLINHSRKSANLLTKIIVDEEKKLRLCLVTSRDIAAGEELLFNYGDRSPLSIAGNPWLVED